MSEFRARRAALVYMREEDVEMVLHKRSRMREGMLSLGWEVLHIAASELGTQASLERAASCDIVVILGGPDIDPVRYGGNAVYAGAPVFYDTEGDAAQLAVLTQSLELQQPVLGICRGMQLMAVHQGGGLIQSVREHTMRLRQQKGHDLPRVLHCDEQHGDHSVHVVKHTVHGTGRQGVLRLLVPQGAVVSSHRQSVDPASLPQGFEIVATSADGIVEAMSHSEYPWLGLQWHPEHPRADEGELLRVMLSLIAGA